MFDCDVLSDKSLFVRSAIVTRKIKGAFVYLKLPLFDAKNLLKNKLFKVLLLF